jgi:hypothetical protein
MFSLSPSSGSLTASLTHLVNFSFLKQSEPGVHGLKSFGPPAMTVVAFTTDSLQGTAARKKSGGREVLTLSVGHFENGK